MFRDHNFCDRQRAKLGVMFDDEGEFALFNDKIERKKDQVPTYRCVGLISHTLTWA